MAEYVSEVAREEHERDLALAWHIGKFNHADPKRYPKLADLLKRNDAKRLPNAEELRAKLNRVFGFGGGKNG